MPNFASSIKEMISGFIAWRLACRPSFDEAYLRLLLLSLGNMSLLPSVTCVSRTLTVMNVSLSGMRNESELQ